MQARSPAGARRYIGQSGCYYYRTGDGLANESEPWVEHGPPLVAGGVGALTAVEQRTLRPNGPLAGIALRYGFFYGPGTWSHPDGDVAAQLRAGRYPVLGTGAARWSFVHIDDAVAATVAAVEFTSPVALGRWLPAFAQYLGAPSPPHVPTGPDTDPDGRFYAELLRGADNHLARKELGFDPPCHGLRHTCPDDLSPDDCEPRVWVRVLGESSLLTWAAIPPWS